VGGKRTLAAAGSVAVHHGEGKKKAQNARVRIQVAKQVLK